MKKHLRKKLYIAGVLMALSMMLLACQSSSDGRSVIKEKDQTTVVLSNTDTIKPQKGAVKETLSIPNFVGYDFVSNDALVGYKYSNSIFGDDRGLYKWTIGKAEDLQNEKLPFEENPKVLKLSFDKSKMVFVPEKTSGTKQIQIYDFLSEKTTAFAMPIADYFWTFTWFSSGGGGAMAATRSDEYTYIEYDGQNTFSSYPIRPNKGQGEAYAYLESYVFKRQDKLYYWQFGKNAGLKAYDLKQKVAVDVLSEKNISQFIGSKDENWLALTQYVDGGGNKLKVYNFELKKAVDLYEAALISHMTWSADSKKLAFSAVDNDGEVGLYYADLEKGQTVYLGTYPGQGVRQMAFSPSGSKLMVAFLNGRAENAIWETQVLSIQ